MFLPHGRFAHAKPWLCAKPDQLIVGSQRSTDTKIHRGKAVSERVLLHSDHSDVVKDESTTRVRYEDDQQQQVIAGLNRNHEGYLGATGLRSV